MKILTANHSSYPKVGEGVEGQQLRRAIEQCDRKEISEEELEEAIGQTIAGTIAEEERAGIDLVTDGQIRWFDPVTHWLKGFKGVRLGGLVRFFDTNRYYRVPKIEGPLQARENPAIRRDLALAGRSAKKSVKAVLTGPITLAFLSERGPVFEKIEDLVESLATRMRDEISGPAADGPVWIQVDEPVVLRRPELFPLLFQTLKKLSEKKGHTKILLATYFADAAPYYEKFQDLPVDGLGLDCVYGPRLLKRIAKDGSGKDLSLGIVDGRSTRLESPEELTKPLKEIRKTLGERELHLTSSCGLDYLPREKAFEKLCLLVRLKERIS